MGTEYATMDTVLPETDLHISGTVKGAKGMTFWLTQPRPKGISPDKWENILQKNWDRIFGKKGRTA